MLDPRPAAEEADRDRSHTDGIRAGATTSRGYTTPQACELTGATYRQLTSWAHSGRLIPSVHRGDGTPGHRGAHRWSEDDLERIRQVLDDLADGWTLAAALRRALGTP